MINGLCKDGFVDCSLLLFNEITNQDVEPDSYTYNTVVCGLCSSGKWEEVRSLVSEMKEKGVKQDCVTYTS